METVSTAQELKTGLIKAHHYTITLDQVLSVLEIVQVPSDFMVDVKLFAGFCCLTERLFDLYSMLVDHACNKILWPLLSSLPPINLQTQTNRSERRDRKGRFSRFKLETSRLPCQHSIAYFTDLPIITIESEF